MTEGFETPHAKLFTVQLDGRIAFDWDLILREAHRDGPMRLWCEALLQARYSGRRLPGRKQ